MSEKCYRCGSPKATTLKDQWLEADLFEKVMSMFFGVLIFGSAGLAIVGLTALVLEVANSY